MEYVVAYGRGIRKGGFKSIDGARRYAYSIAGRIPDAMIIKVNFYGSENMMGIVKRMKKEDLASLKSGFYYQEGMTYYNDWSRGGHEYILNKNGTLGERIL